MGGLAEVVAGVPGWLSAWGFSATLLGVLVLLVLRFGQRLPGTARLLLIGLALLRFAVPPLPQTSIDLMPQHVVPFEGSVSPGEPSSDGASPAPAHHVEGSPTAASRGLGQRARLANPPLALPAAQTPWPTRADGDRTAGPGGWRAWRPLLWKLWAGGGLIMLCLRVGQHLRLRRWIRAARPVRAVREWPDLWPALLEQLPLRRVPRVLFSPHAPSPLSAGTLHPVIVLPASMRDRLTPPQWRTVLAHELAHHHHRDLWWNGAAFAVLCLWWFHPVVWMLGRGLRQCQEDRCDDGLLRRGLVDGEAYCEVLLAVATRLRAPASPVAMAMGHPRHSLARRFRRLLDPSLSRSLIMPRWCQWLAVMGGATLLLVGFGPGRADGGQVESPREPAIPLRAQPAEPSPAAALGAALLGEDVTLTLTKEGDVLFDGVSYDRDLLGQALAWARARDPELSVRVRAGAHSAVKDVLELMQFLRDAGIEHIELLAPKAPASPTELPAARQDVSAAGGGGRSKLTQDDLVGPKGGASTRAAVNDGLAWLVHHQSVSGGWDADDFSAACGDHADCGGEGQALMDVGVTGLSLMALLGAGHTTKSGAYRENVQAAIDFLLGLQDAEGTIGPRAHLYSSYNHAIASVALIEAFHLGGDERLREPAERALAHVHRSRNPYKAWRYDYPPAGDNDVSVTGWMLWALFAGQDAGLTIDRGAIEGGMAYIEEMTDPATGRTGYHEVGSRPARTPDTVEDWPPDRVESMTALALLMRVFHGEDPARSSAIRMGADLLENRCPQWNPGDGSIDYYYWFYGSYAAWQISGRTWSEWQQGLLNALVPHQVSRGGAKGSWDPELDPWGRIGGRVYATAINVLSLEVYDRYARIRSVR